MTDCIFCKIASHEIPSNIVYEDEDVVAFLDLSQVTKGHTLLIPKQHVADIFEYDAELAQKVLPKIPLVAQAIEQSDKAIKGMNILNNNGRIAHQTVFHSHIHLLPRYEDTAVDGFGLKWETHDEHYTQEDFRHVLENIKKHLEG